MDPRAIELLDKVMEPASWFATFVYKPMYVFQTMRIAIPWKISTRISISNPLVISFFQALRTSPPPFPTNNLKIGAAGFCWGGKHTILLAQDSPSSRAHRHESQINSATLEPLIDCAFTAHPSYLDIPTDIEAINIPISVAVGDEDAQMKPPQIQQMKEILEGKKDGGHEVKVFQGARHGFAVRNHPDDKHEMECAEKAEVQAIEWFTRWFVA
jgi:dienelactone hydrolase